MNFNILQPPQQLTDYVRFFWFLEGNATEHKPFDHRILADPCPELIFYYKGQFKYDAEFEAGKTLTSGIFGQKQPSARSLQNQISAFLVFTYTLMPFLNYFACQHLRLQISRLILKRFVVKQVKSLKKK